METTKVRITWSGQGGELYSATVTVMRDDDYAVQRALVKLVSGHIVNPGDSFTVEEI